MEFLGIEVVWTVENLVGFIVFVLLVILLVWKIIRMKFYRDFLYKKRICPSCGKRLVVNTSRHLLGDGSSEYLECSKFQDSGSCGWSKKIW